MTFRAQAEAQFASQVDAWVASPPFRALEEGGAPRSAYDDFLANVCVTHLKSPQILGFLYAVAPPAALAAIEHNLLEELGRDGDGGTPHPALLRRLAAALDRGAAGVAALEAAAQEDVRRLASDPLLYGTVKELGLAVLLEVAAFEWMLARAAGRIARLLARHRHLDADALAWFTHHGEVDLRHAEEQLDAIERYVEHYELGGEAEAILAITFRENVFAKRYFRS